MAKKNVLVCGCTGFIGRNIAEELAKNKQLNVFGTYFKSRPFKNPNITMVKADLTSRKDVNKVIIGKDIVIQAAATTSGAKDIITRPYIHVTDNAVMNSLIFRSAYEHKVSHVIFFSCSVMYQPGDKPVKEIDFDANKEIFRSYFGVGWTKVYIEKLCEFYSRLGVTKYTVVRHSNIYGPYDKYDLERSHVMGATITKVMREKGKDITVWGTGEEERDLLYVTDLVNFVKFAMDRQKEQFGLYNVGYGSSISVNELAEKIMMCAGKSLTISHDISKPTIKTKLCLDITKAQECFGWNPAISLEEGIKKTIQWYKKHVKM